jgi:cytochrome c553
MHIRHILSSAIVLLSAATAPCALSTPEQIKHPYDQPANIERGREVYPLCAACHLDNGWGKKDGSFPVIAGQHRKVLLKQLDDIRARHRENPTMFPFSDPDTIGGEQAVIDVTGYIATLPPNPSPGTGDGSQLALGKKIYQQHCTECHGKRGMGDNDRVYPRLQGQHHAYLLRQLKWIRDGYRKNSNPAMVVQVKTLGDNELDAVADYISRL